MERDDRRTKDPGGSRMNRELRLEPVRGKMEPVDTHIKQMASYNPLRMDKKTDRMNDLYERGSI